MPEQKQRVVGYQLFTRNALGEFPDSGSCRDLGIKGIAARVQGNTELKAIWSIGISSENQQILGGALAQNAGAQLRALVGDSLWIVDPLQALAGLPSDAFTMEKIHTIPQQPSIQINCLLCKNLKPEGSDDGKFGILFNSTDWGPNGSTTAEAIYVYGDSNLYMRFVEFYGRIQQSESDLTARQTHTYSAIHDHWASFFPSQQAGPATQDLIAPLEQGLSATLAPTKVRLVMPQLDDQQYHFLKKLSIYQAQFQIDLQIIGSAESSNTEHIEDILADFPANTIRRSPIVLNEGGLASRFMLIDGPYALGDGTVLESRRIVFLFGCNFEQAILENDWSAWLRVVDKDLFQAMEQHFNSIWNALELRDTLQDSLQPPADLDQTQLLP